MRLEVLARRLSEKTETPELEPVLLKRAGVETLPPRCLIWQGATSVPRDKPTPRARTYDLARSNNREVYWYVQKPMPVIQFDGRRQGVHRLIFQLVVEPDYEFTMRRQCDNPLCVNPTHFVVERIEPRERPQNPAPVIQEPPMEDEWTLSEALEIVELYLGQDPQPASFEEAAQHNLLLDVPEALLREAFKLSGKGHLT